MWALHRGAGWGAQGGRGGAEGQYHSLHSRKGQQAALLSVDLFLDVKQISPCIQNAVRKILWLLFYAFHITV